MASPTASLITCSFSGDLDVCALLCRSVDRFVPGDIQHNLYVPARDMRLFSGFATRQRTIRAQEDLLPPWFWKAPLPGPKWRERLRLPRRNVYLTPYSLPVRGWIAQQIMKISASLRAATEIVVHLDSDVVIVRPFSHEHLMHGGRVRLHAQPHASGLAEQRPWYEAGVKLLGLPPCDYGETLYVDQLVVWRQSLVRGLVARIESATGRDWRVALARTPQFAEYVLYGMYVEEVLGADAAGVYVEPRSLCHSCWTGRICGADEENAFVSGLRPDQVACLIQSTLPVPLDERTRVFAKATTWAASADARAA